MEIVQHVIEIVHCLADRDFDCVRLPMVICSKEQLAISSSVISINGNLNRNGNIRRNIGMRNRKYFENGNRIEIVIVI